MSDDSLHHEIRWNVAEPAEHHDFFFSGGFGEFVF